VRRALGNGHGPPQRLPQFFRVQRLRQEIVRARLYGCDRQRHGPPGGECQDGNVFGFLPEDAQEFELGLPGKVDGEQDGGGIRRPGPTTMPSWRSNDVDAVGVLGPRGVILRFQVDCNSAS
jgi:hypothetical protein